jgi:hypothetical protein
MRHANCRSRLPLCWVLDAIPIVPPLVAEQPVEPDANFRDRLASDANQDAPPAAAERSAMVVASVAPASDSRGDSQAVTPAA